MLPQSIRPAIYKVELDDLETMMADAEMTEGRVLRMNDEAMR